MRGARTDHSELYSDVACPRCDGCAISVTSSGAADAANVSPKPIRNLVTSQGREWQREDGSVSISVGRQSSQRKRETGSASPRLVTSRPASRPRGPWGAASVRRERDGSTWRDGST